MKIRTMVPNMPRTTLVHIGQLFLRPLTKETIDKTKLGIKTKRMAQMMIMNINSATHASMKIPKNAMLLPTFA